MFAYPGRKWKIAEKKQKIKNTICFEITPYMKFFCQKKAKNRPIKCPFLEFFPFPAKTLFFFKLPPIWRFFLNKTHKTRCPFLEYFLIFLHFSSIFCLFLGKNLHIGGDFKNKIVFFQEISGNAQIGADHEIFGKHFKSAHFICPFFAFFWQKNFI